MKNTIEKLWRRSLRTIFKVLFRVQIKGLEHLLESDGPTLIVSNHNSLLDGVFLYLFLPSPPIFLVSKATFQLWFFKPFLYPIRKFLIDDLHPMKLKTVIKELILGKTIVVFPEGRITTTGVLMKIYDGPAMLAAKSTARIVPIGLEGLQHSRFSYLKQILRLKMFPPVKITILPGKFLPPHAELPVKTRRKRRSQAMFSIMKEISFANALEKENLFGSLIRSAKKHGFSTPILSDPNNAGITYISLIARSFILGGFLEKTVHNSNRVGILLPSSAAAATTFFALQYLGKEAVLLNFSGGSTPLVKSVNISRTNIIITSRAFIDIAGLQKELEAIRAIVTVIFLEDVRDQIPTYSKINGYLKALLSKFRSQPHTGNIKAENCAVILFTSGSEGDPKGVALSHLNILSNFAQTQLLISINKTDHVLNVLPIFHAFGLVVGLITPLLKGTPSYQYPSPLHYRKIPEICYQHNISCLLGTNTFLANYAKYASSYDFYKIRWVLSGAEKLTQPTKELWQSSFGIRIFEGYGVTEASPVLAVNHPLSHRDNTVGQLLPHIDHEIISVEGLSDGGELAVKGPNIMLGYLNGSGEIEPTFGAPGEGWYDTGDIVKIDDDGFISIIGRQKRFAKIGGEMVSLAAIENFVRTEWPDHEHAAVSLEDDNRGEKIILLSTHRHLERSLLVGAGKRHGLTGIAIPKQIFYIKEIPYLSTGKVNHKALKKLSQTLTTEAH